MKDRLLEFLRVQNLSATQFADEMGVQRSGVSHILSGRNNPGYEFLQKMLTRYPHLNAEWIILGKGTMTKYSEAPRNDLFSSAPTGPSDFNTAKAAKAAASPEWNAAPNGPSDFNAATAEANLGANAAAYGAEVPSEKEFPPTPLNASSAGIERVIIFYANKTCTEYKLV